MFQKNDMSFINVVAIGIGSIVGAGIFALLGQVILISRLWTYASFLIAGIAAMFSGYSYAKLSAKFPVSGGLTDFFHIAYKNRWLSGGLTILYMLTSAISISMMAKSFGIYAAHLAGNTFPQQLTINTAAVILIAAMSFLNMLGAQDSSRTETVLVALKLLILTALFVRRSCGFTIRPTQRRCRFLMPKVSGEASALPFSLMPDTALLQMQRETSKIRSGQFLWPFTRRCLSS